MMSFRHLHQLEAVNLPACWATVGVYDGVHRGHQVLLQQLVAGAHAAGLPAVVVTFHPHPAVVLGHDPSFRLLTTPEERAALLRAEGVDLVLTLPFTRQLAALSAEAFMQRLQAHLNLQHLWIGYDFALGHERGGDYARLQALGQKLGYRVSRVDAVREGGQVLSSSAVRQALSWGDVAKAARILGRPYALTGEVVPGDGRGRTINMPTANLLPPKEKLLPASGVYVCRAWHNGASWGAVVNIGRRPTFYAAAAPLTIEAHLLDFAGDLYGQMLRLEFLARLRAERRFADVAALRQQIAADIAAARRYLGL